MSRMKMDDIVFGRSLREPGYRVDFAVGTTYSLELDTFISIPFSLGFLEEPDEVMKKSLTYIFAALRLCSDRLAVFCNFADIKVPPKDYKVYCALMEGSVFPVNVSRKDRLVNFHPKVWVVRQTSLEKEDSIIRVIVMSRNLTGSGALDCACVLTGRIGERQAPAESRARHKPLSDFLKFLCKYASDTKQEQIASLARDILRIDRFDVAGPYDDYAFLPMGIRGYSGEAELDELHRSVRIAVVSPFLDDVTVNQLASAREERLLVTQEPSINQSVVDAFGKENVYTLNPGMTDNDLDESVNLHAKMYFSTRWDDEWRNYLYLGSTNATRNGFSSNVEFLVRMRFKKYSMSWYEFADYFKNDPDRRFMPMADVFKGTDSQAEEYRQSIRLRQAIASITHGDVKKEGEVYSICMTMKGEDPETEVSPLMRPDLKSALRPGLVFSGMALTELSEFYVVTSAGLSRVVKIPTTVIPKERDEAICLSFIPDKDQFMDCISFLLSESKTVYVLSRMADYLKMGEGITRMAANPFPAVYENLLREAYDSPDTFEDIRAFVESLPAKVIPPEFDGLYHMIMKAIDGFKR